MQLFKELGEQIETVWRDRNYSEAEFPALAAEALREAELPSKLSVWQTLEWVLSQDVLPVQQDLRADFGEPPVTVFNGTRFYIDVYFWFEGTTGVHQHGFCGAFQVWQGSSIHSVYDFAESEKINEVFLIGDIRLKTCELLKVGDVQQILPGNHYIHSLFHLDQPSVTIIARTQQSPCFLPQFDYRKPVLAIDPFYQEPNTLKKLQCVSALVRAKHPETDTFIAEWLEKADFQTTYIILLNTRFYLRSNQFEQAFGLGTLETRFDKFMEIIRRRHGAKAEVFPQVFEHQTRIDTIAFQRSFITNSEHRFFLALLMNLENRTQIFELVRARFPDDEPLEKILDWTFELSEMRVMGTNLPNALGIAGFDHFDLFVFENLLRDKSETEIRGLIETEHGSKMNDKLTESLSKLREAIIFQPLLKS